ncbi:MAG: hypothetical protein K1X72_09820 [Pyrinomonadaceae bacterium]|nr:hypothetical protein [Pyrinomonadaceae bacterium]
MKNSIKMLFVVALILLAMSFSAFGSTKRFQTQNKSDKALKNSQIASLQSTQFKKAQLNYDLAKSKCVKLLSISKAIESSWACEAATIALAAAITAVGVACSSGNVPACVVATAAMGAAYLLVKETCGKSGIAIELPEDGLEASNRKFLKSKKNIFKFGT